MPTTRKATAGPAGLTLGAAQHARSAVTASRAGRGSPCRRARRRPAASVNEASTWCGSDWSGILPATSLTTRGRSFGATSNTLK